ncbi:MAG TPA: 16S rRNA (guanine(966)-N(2))-methyltransferase RsmD [Fastidiosipila sp.]|jgi:16S rRNA (guanine966-N2)-methyltransferase|nr:16S rRNA (guanine(966)-N(2))-methyltransferase RsmD [Fastidiosipila sp.]
MPRIIAGEKKGLPLLAPKGEMTRPTGDRTKEALFSILQPDLKDARFLDLFAGSGQIGLEALSRGASHVVFSELSGKVRAMLTRNIKSTGYEENARVLGGSADRTCRLLIAEGETFDLIYADPPWPDVKAQIDKIEKHIHELLDKGGSFILEAPKTLDTAPFVTGLEHSRRCRYGSAMLFFYTKQ